MRILFLTTQLPYPPKSGGLIKSWNLLQHWSDKHEIALIHPYKNDEQKHLSEFLSQVKLRDHFAIPIHTERSALNLLKSYLGHASLNVFRNYHSEIKVKVEEWSKQADVLFIDHYEMGQYIPKDFKGKTVLHEHNAEFVMWKRLAELETNPVRKTILNLESKRILKAEKNYAGKSDLILAAPNDMEELEAQGVDKSKMRETFHLGEDFMLNAPDVEFSATKKSLLYVGTLTWEANVDGLLWFLETCWTKIREVDSEVTLTIVGKNPDPRILKATASLHGISLLGFVEDLEEVYASHRVFIVPLRFGSGIKVKVLNALYRGIPMVTTPIGTEGLEAKHGKELFETTHSESYCQHVGELLENEESWIRMRDASRLLARKYTWKKLLAEHDAQLEALFSEKS